MTTAAGSAAALAMMGRLPRVSKGYHARQGSPRCARLQGRLYRRASFAGVRPLALDRFRHREACERHRRRWGDCNALVQWRLAHGTAPNPDPLVRYLRT